MLLRAEQRCDVHTVHRDSTGSGENDSMQLGGVRRTQRAGRGFALRLAPLGWKDHGPSVTGRVDAGDQNSAQSGSPRPRQSA